MIQPEAQVDFSPFDMPTRKSRVETYVWDHADEISEGLAHDLYDRNRPLNYTAVLVPIAAHQEADNILPALAHYASQKEADPFTVCLFLNYPADRAVAAEESEARVREAQSAYPGLDIRYAKMSYADKTPIGQIRKDLWDAVTRIALVEGVYDKPGQEIIGISHDIDTMSISSHYIRNIQNYYLDQQVLLTREEMIEEPMESRFTQVKHFYPFDTHPNLARAIFWQDFATRQIARNGVYEEGMAMPLSYYAKQGGFKADHVTHETRHLTPRRLLGIPGTGMETSPRRYIARLGEYGVQAIWTEDSFTANDDCRDPKKLPGDITYRQLEDSVLSTLDESVYFFANGVPYDKWDQIKMKALHDALFRAYDPVEYAQNLNLYNEVRDVLAPRIYLAKSVLERLGLADISQVIDEKTIHNLVYEYQGDVKAALDESVSLFVRK